MQIESPFTKIELVEHIERLETLMLQCDSEHTERRTFYAGRAAGQIELLNALGVLTRDEAIELERRLAAHWHQSFGDFVGWLPFTPRRAEPKTH
jgi:translation initiation factor 2 gamma subunit (eIF-2gamma)